MVGAALAIAPAAAADLASLEEACQRAGRLHLLRRRDPRRGRDDAEPRARLARCRCRSATAATASAGCRRRRPRTTARARTRTETSHSTRTSRCRAAAARLPLIVLMHTCCSADKRNFESKTVEATGELWHYSNAWFASRGYAVLNYTSRGFVDAQGHGSTGDTQIDSRRYEVNDLQQLACLLAADATSTHARRAAADRPARVVVSGGSYGGGLAWLAMTDPHWDCAALGRPDLRPGSRRWPRTTAGPISSTRWSRTARTFATRSRRATWPRPRRRAPSACRAARSSPRSTCTGSAGDPRTGGHATFPAELDHAIACLQATSRSSRARSAPPRGRPRASTSSWPTAPPTTRTTFFSALDDGRSAGAGV